MLIPFLHFMDPRKPGGLDVRHYATILTVTLILGIGVGVSGTLTVQHGVTYFRSHYQASLRVPTDHERIPIIPGSSYPSSGSIALGSYPAVGDQGPLGACAAWATAWDASYLWRRSHPGSWLRFSPRYLYAYYSNTYHNGQDAGSWPDQNLALANSTGIPQFSSLPYPPFVQPSQDATVSSSVLANAARHRFQPHLQHLSEAQGGGQGAVDAIKSGITQGDPMLLAFPVWPEYDGAAATAGLVTSPTAAELLAEPQGRGGHENVGIAFSDTKVFPDGSIGGVEVQNQWTRAWGHSGRAWLSYDFVRRFVFGIELLTIGNVGVGYYPAGSAFGLSAVSQIIHSSYWWESSVLAGSTPVQDTDYMLPWGAHELVTLPGRSSATYQLIQAHYAFGSGQILTFQGGNGGRFAFLHLVNDVWVRGQSFFHGGQTVGVSGWPTDPLYGNGSSGESNAHLCLVTDWAGASLLYGVTHPPPARFPTHAWTSWTRKHHKRPIPHTYHGHLTTISRSWWHSPAHRLYGAPRTLEHYTRRYHVMEEWFVRGKAFSWPSHSKWGAKWVKA